MKRILLGIGFALIASLSLARAASAMSWKEVAALTEDGVADSLIIQKIVYSGQVFHLEAKDIRDLKQAGVSDEVISVMLRTEAQDQGDQGDYHGDSHSHISVGLGFGYYGGYWPYYAGYPYYGYYAPYYRPYYPYYRSYYYPRYYPRSYGYRPYARPGYNYGTTRPRYNVNYGPARSRTTYTPRAGYAHPAPGGGATRHR